MTVAHSAQLFSILPEEALGGEFVTGILILFFFFFFLIYVLTVPEFDIYRQLKKIGYTDLACSVNL